ncbi:MAG: LysM peptidoglycan-binding domain-containing protein [Fuerstiella sp.]
MGTHTVKPGETLSLIARKHGWKNWQELYNHPDNAPFRKKRPDPNRIEPGDKITIPGGSTNKRGRQAGAPVATPIENAQYEWVLCAVDGTLSEGYQSATNTSYVKKFFHDFKTSKSLKKYFPGPDVSALGVTTIANMVAGGLGGMATEMACRTNRISNCNGVLNIASAAGKWLKGTIATLPDAKIVLAGHSRGGLIAINLAMQLHGLGRSVYFLGLYDAVDMALGMDTDVIPRNVEKVAHARRSPTIGSRRSWGNTGTKSANSTPGAYQQRFFNATHGSVGGSIPASCDAPMKTHPAIPATYIVSKLSREALDACDVPVTAMQNRSGGVQADTWIRSEARSLNPPVPLR